MSKLRKRLNDKEAEFLGLGLKKHDIDRPTARYTINEEQFKKLSVFRTENKLINKKSKVSKDKPFVLSAWNSKGHMMSIDEYCDFYKLPRKDILKYKLVSHTGTPFYNIEFRDKIENASSILDLEDYAIRSINKYIKNNVKKSKNKIKQTSFDEYNLFDLAIYTDVHIGMEPNKNSLSLYGGSWNSKELEIRKQILIQRILKNQKSNKLVIFDLGDLMDGWDGETVRKGHSLPQNMTNEEAFDVGLDFKISLTEELLKHFTEVQCINICDDNHSGSFAYVVNSSFKRFIEHKYNSVNVINQRKFIDHYIFDNKCFVATHGKDGKNLKFGFKPKLDPAQVEKIENYLSEHELIIKGLKVFFIKGDSHQDIFDNSTSQKFYYWNIPPLSPSSNWVQTNFKKGISGFYTFNFEKETYSQHPYYFKWK